LYHVPGTHFNTPNLTLMPHMRSYELHTHVGEAVHECV